MRTSLLSLVSKSTKHCTRWRCANSLENHTLWTVMPHVLAIAYIIYVALIANWMRVYKRKHVPRNLIVIGDTTAYKRRWFRWYAPDEISLNRIWSLEPSVNSEQRILQEERYNGQVDCLPEKALGLSRYRVYGLSNNTSLIWGRLVWTTSTGRIAPADH